MEIIRWDEARLKRELARSEAWRLRALELLYAKQTAAERAERETLFHNAEGFGQADAARLSRIAEARAKGYALRASEKEWLALLIPKYWKQLLRAIATKATAQGKLHRQCKHYVEVLG